MEERHFHHSFWFEDLKNDLACLSWPLKHCKPRMSVRNPWKFLLNQSFISSHSLLDIHVQPNEILTKEILKLSKNTSFGAI